MRQPENIQAHTAAPMGFREFVCLMAALMAINALGVDMMLPALPDMSRALGMAHHNQAQWIIVSYLIGMGAMQIVYGPLTDRYGRIPVALGGLALYGVASFAAVITSSMTTMLIARLAQGMGGAAVRVVAVAMVRDCYSGRQMARVMSLTFVIFLMVPILAPALGTILLLFAPWRMIFAFYSLISALVALWIVLRMRETLAPENRRAISVSGISSALGLVIGNRLSLGYTLSLTMSFGAMFGFITSAQQVFSESFDLSAAFPVLFALVASGMVFAQYFNSRVVVRLGSRIVSHSGLGAYIIVAAVQFILLLMLGAEPVRFLILLFLTTFCSGLMGPNFGAMAMEPMGNLAGTASAVQGTISTLGGAAVGFLIGQAFDGSVVPLAAGYLVAGLFILIFVLYAERGRLFRPTQQLAPPTNG